MMGIVERAKNSFLGSVVGLLLIVGCPVFLFLNEGKAVKMAEALDHLAHVVHHVGSHHVDPQNNGNIVHVDGPVDVKEPAQDPLLQLPVKSTVLYREVKVFQKFKHKDKKTGEVRTEKRWVREYRQEGSVGSQQFFAQKVQVGEFELSSKLIREMQRFPRQFVPVAKKNINKKNKGPAEQDLLHGFRVQKGFLYKGKSIESPHVGDVKIGYYKVAPSNVSVIAKQDNKELVAYNPSDNVSIMFRNDFTFIQPGKTSAQDMLVAREKNVAHKINMRRVGGILFLLLGFILLFGPFAAFVRWIPIVNGIVGLGILLASFVLTAGISALSIAAGWIAYRPLVFVIALLVVAILFIGVGRYGKSHNA